MNNTDDIDKAIDEILTDAIAPNGFFFEDAYLKSKNEAKQSLHQLIAKEVKKARIDELKHIELNDIGPVYAWTTGNDPDMAMLISERINELEKELK